MKVFENLNMYVLITPTYSWREKFPPSKVLYNPFFDWAISENSIQHYLPENTGLIAQFWWNVTHFSGTYRYIMMNWFGYLLLRIPILFTRKINKFYGKDVISNMLHLQSVIYFVPRKLHWLPYIIFNIVISTQFHKKAYLCTRNKRKMWQKTSD